MSMNQRFMAMPMCVRLVRWVGSFMGMLMVLVVHMAVLVLQRLMTMLVLVSLREMQPQTDCHEAACNE
jgi:hypothetical protein